jgi:hypothetical protein
LLPILEDGRQEPGGRFSPRSGHHGCRKSPPGLT